MCHEHLYELCEMLQVAGHAEPSSSGKQLLSACQRAAKDSLAAACHVLVLASRHEPSMLDQVLHSTFALSAALDAFAAAPVSILRTIATAQIAAAAASTASHGASHTNPQRKLLFANLSHACTHLADWASACSAGGSQAAYLRPTWSALCSLACKLSHLHSVQTGVQLPAELATALADMVRAAAGAGVSASLAAMRESAFQAASKHALLPSNFDTELEAALEEDIAAVLHELSALQSHMHSTTGRQGAMRKLPCSKHAESGRTLQLLDCK
jgi:hypothetical protein